MAKYIVKLGNSIGMGAEIAPGIFVDRSNEPDEGGFFYNPV
jgi:hypothetical protein